MKKDKRRKVIKNTIIVAILFILVLSYLYIEGIRDVVNLVVISFIVSYNILLISTYSKIKRTYCMIANNDIKFRYQKAVMVFYLLIFVINICIWIFLWNEYLYSGNDYSLMNDILSIGSLCLAITSDLLADIFERMFSALF